ncbi:LpxL/LpxP family Kdo(2)-lipid IV(A) lauroyl/palmitoleoyl acyltransferase [Aestuariicella hydrocarbonica]|uniref:LpxL/LpxP family Kdo(2)-lipid IV(A) lauroyl/palmitoleoyl acyltransferase n=1 Tax=Pseudomaricurvus hydrocarbonicus TaxID=1470433 RepID=A0A9E5JVZ3_9GAMM|nr:LpxL/LpxP family Kdo(2)-lipid IV(A) lauroyl/palmitoleoyl acyltransferase [Aestuariicella hydrocarbonica]NHO65576.1 LpxL/LpxP family Kdo(2)-lipid IV(A) lauroyl/palmitoleoyl acyltransferase [Aestuariicella hydrocarbonica]
MSEKSFTAPRYWPVWLMIALMYLSAKLPWRAQYQLAKGLSALLYLFARHRRNIIAVNLKLCFPEWDEATHKRKVKETLFNNTLGFIETSNVYYCPIERYRDKVTIHGQDILEAAKAKGKGVLLLGAHYSHLDLGGALVSLICEPYAIYRPNDNPLINQQIVKGRLRFMKDIINRADMRGIMRALKNNAIVWYPPDQDYGKRHTVYAPFFGVNAATITSTTRLSNFNQSEVVMLSWYRKGAREEYELAFSKAPEGFPSGDDTIDATLINKALEDGIRQAPTQYMWTHRRFKTQPDGKGKLYK